MRVACFRSNMFYRNYRAKLVRWDSHIRNLVASQLTGSNGTLQSLIRFYYINWLNCVVPVGLSQRVYLTNGAIQHTLDLYAFSS